MTEAPTKQPSEKSEDRRWWDFYAIRYAMPTIVGFLILFSLKGSLPGLIDIYSKTTGDSNRLGEASLFAALGFVYCYVASTPILVMHCCRYNTARLKQITNWLGLAIVGLILLMVLVVFLKGWSNFFSMKYALALPILVGALLIFFQYRLLLDLCKNYQVFGKFYRELEAKRKNLGELKDSYKHMREHGNAALIVVLEVVLAGFLYSFIQIAECFGVSSNEVHWILPITFAIWVSPAAFIWYVAGVILESELTTKYFDKKKEKI